MSERELSERVKENLAEIDTSVVEVVYTRDAVRGALKVLVPEALESSEFSTWEKSYYIYVGYSREETYTETKGFLFKRIVTKTRNDNIRYAYFSLDWGTNRIELNVLRNLPADVEEKLIAVGVALSKASRFPFRVIRNKM